MEGIGLVISNNPQNGHLEVLASLAGSPAAKAGLNVGDEVVAINQNLADRLGLDKAGSFFPLSLFFDWILITP